MKSSRLALVGVVLLAACTPTPKQSDPLCDREQVEWDKWGTSELPEGCAEPEVMGIAIENVPEVGDGENPGDPGGNPGDPGDNPGDPGGNPGDPDDQASGRKDNGLGNGDQAAPGNSLSHNRAENRVGNPGHASGKPQNSN